MKIIAFAYFYQLTEFGDLMSCDSKDIKKCTQSHLQILRFGKSWDPLKYKNLSILRTERNFFAK